MANIVLTAENFAFGPIGKLLAVAKLLKDQKHNLTFIGYGTSLQLAKKFPFNAVYEIDTDNLESAQKIESIIKSADLLISSMDLQSVIIAQKLNIPVVWIDCLFWFWEIIPAQALDADLYVVEKSIDDSINEIRFKDKITNLLTVGPIINKTDKLTRKKQVLISYGGGEATYYYQVGKDTNYPYILTNILAKYVDWEPFEKIIVATNERVVKDLKNKFPDTRFEFKCLPQEQFAIEMAQSEFILTTTGLVTTELAFTSETPVIFLPPTNNAHYLLLDELRKLNLAEASVHLSDFMEKLEMRGKQESENMPEVLLQMREIEKSTLIQKKIGGKINSLIKNRDKWTKTSVINSKKFIDSLGKDGANIIVKNISLILSARGIK